jgi:SAM-dependent methyltransferase
MNVSFAFVSRWPLPALAVWTLAWAVFMTAASLGPAGWALLLALGVSATGAALVHGGWRRVLVLAGFPASALALGVAPALPAWGWLLLLLPLLLAYPLRAWRDAPFFPTPAGALDGLPAVVGHPARILEAGCGLGHGLVALRRQFPAAELVGLEWSPLLAVLARLRCRDARVRRGDLWAERWGAYGLVYLFQRPESMPRAWAKACAEMPGGWLVSLEFAVPGVTAVAQQAGAGGRPLWVYRVPAAGHHSMATPGCR